MALSVFDLQRVNLGNKVKILGKMAFDTSYRTGGLPITSAMLGLASIDDANVLDQESGMLFDCDVEADSLSFKTRVFQGGGGGFVPAGTNSPASAGTPAGTVTAPIFTGGNPAIGGSNTIFHDAAPPGHHVFLNWDATGRAWLECDNAFTTADDFQLFTTQNSRLMVKYDPAPAGPQVYFSNGLNLLKADITGWGANLFLSCHDGNVLQVIHEAGVLAGDFALFYNDSLFAGNRAFYINNTVSGANKTITTLGSKAWIAPQPSGTNSVPAFTGAAMGNHNHIFTGVAAPFAAAAEVANGTDLSVTLSEVEFEVIGT